MSKENSYMSFKTEEELREYRIRNGGTIWDKRINSETGMIEVDIRNFNTVKYSPVTTWSLYKKLSDDAKEIINCLKYDIDTTGHKADVCIKIGITFITDDKNEIQITDILYKELFEFVRGTHGIGYARYDVEDGEEIQMWLPIENGIQLK